jgi:hypothetical protein
VTSGGRVLVVADALGHLFLKGGPEGLSGDRLEQPIGAGQVITPDARGPDQLAHRHAFHLLRCQRLLCRLARWAHADQGPLISSHAAELCGPDDRTISQTEPPRC